MTTAVVAATLHLVLLGALTATCAFDGARPSPGWTDCVIPLGLLGSPLVLAAAALLRRSRSLLVGAAVAAGLLGVAFVIGPGIFLLVVALFYGIAAAQGFSAEGSSGRARTAGTLLGILALVLVATTVWIMAASGGRRERSIDSRPATCESIGDRGRCVQP